MKIEITSQLPTLNTYINAERTYRYIAAKLKKEATEAVAWECKSLSSITKLADYTFTWYVKDKRTDPDNRAFSCKFIFDGLMMAGKLPNDSMRYVRNINHRFVVGEPKVIVDIKEC